MLTASAVSVPETTPGAPSWTDVVAVKSPHAAITDGPDGPSLRLWYSAFGRESGDSDQFGMSVPIPPTYSVGYALARQGDPTALARWPYGPVVDRVDAFLDHKEELGPGVVQLVDGDGATPAYLMYYLARELAPGLVVDGEMQLATALDGALRREHFPFSTLVEDANVLVFPSLDAGNLALQLLQQVDAAVVVAPILMGTRHPVHLLQYGMSVEEVVNIVTVGIVEASRRPELA